MAQPLPLTINTTSEQIVIARNNGIAKASIKAADIRRVGRMALKAMERCGMRLLVSGELSEDERRRIEITYPQIIIVVDCATADP